MTPKKLPTSVWMFLWKYLSSQKVLFFSVISAVILSEFLIRMSLYFAAQIVEIISSDIDMQQRLHGAIVAAVWASVLLLAKSAVQNISIFVEARFMPVCVVKVAKDLFSYVHKHSTAFFAEEMAGNISGKVKTIIDGIYPIFYNLLWGFFSPFIAMAITFFFVFKINLSLSFLLLILNICMVYLIFLLSKQMVPVSENRAKTMSEANGVLVDSIANATIVKNFAMFGFEKRYYFKQMRIAAAADRKETMKFGKIFFWQNLLRYLLQIIFYILPIWFWYEGKIDIADFVLIQSLITILNNTFNMLSMNFMNIFKLYGNFSDGLKLLSKPCDVNDARNAFKLSVKKGDVVFKNVKYHYKNSNDLLNNFNLQIGAKEKVGLVGHSGAGKSTIIKLLSRYYDVLGGTITIDGKNIAKCTQDSLRQNIALISQDPSLFNRSIKENIAYGRPNATDEEVYQAAKIANIHDFIMKLPNGYESKVGERGVMLSGGERQRIAIARAILKNAPILILDEATSALDSISEKLIQNSLRELMKNKAVIAIAHRLSTLREMDRIVVLDKGEIVESGSHQSLLAKKGKYYEFYKMQSEGFIT